MKILITGNEGFLGQHLTHYLKDHQIIGWDIKNGKDIFDISIGKQIASCDIVIHLAALTNVRHSFDNPTEAYRINTLGSCEIEKWCIKNNKKMIFISTIATTDRFSSPYAESKALAEDILEKFNNATILRFSNMLGLNMNENSGSLIYKFSQGIKKGKISITGDGSQTRNFIHTKDITKIIEAAIEDDWSGKKVDCITDNSYSIKQIAQLFQQYTGVKIEYIAAEKGPKELHGNSSLLKKLYHKKLNTNVEKDIKEIIEKL